MIITKVCAPITGTEEKEINGFYCQVQSEIHRTFLQDMLVVV